MLKKLGIFFLIITAILLFLYWVYFPSVSRYRELKLEEERITKRIQEIDSQIKTLSDERNLLQTDVTYLEKVIREELGFVKPGEIVYELITRKKLLEPVPAKSATGPSGSETTLKKAAVPEKNALETTTAVAAKTQNAVLSSKGKIVRKSN